MRAAVFDIFHELPDVKNFWTLVVGLQTSFGFFEFSWGEGISGGSEIPGKRPISWTGGGERKVEEMNEGEKEVALAEHSDGGLMALWGLRQFWIVRLRK